MDTAVVDDTDHEQFAATIEGDTAKLEYQLEGDRLLLLHTEVPEAFRGQGMGGQLVEAAIAKAQTDHLTVVPWCPYARRWLKEHPDAVGDVSVDYKTPPPQD